MNTLAWAMLGSSIGIQLRSISARTQNTLNANPTNPYIQSARILVCGGDKLQQLLMKNEPFPFISHYEKTNRTTSRTTRF